MWIIGEVGLGGPLFAILGSVSVVLVILIQHLFVHQVAHIDSQQRDLDCFNRQPHSQDPAWVSTTQHKPTGFSHNLRHPFHKSSFLFIIFTHMWDFTCQKQWQCQGNLTYLWGQIKKFMWASTDHVWMCVLLYPLWGTVHVDNDLRHLQIQQTGSATSSQASHCLDPAPPGCQSCSGQDRSSREENTQRCSSRVWHQQCWQTGESILHYWVYIVESTVIGRFQQVNLRL